MLFASASALLIALASEYGTMWNTSGESGHPEFPIAVRNIQGSTIRMILGFIFLFMPFIRMRQLPSIPSVMKSCYTE